ncbi:DUF4174 domain-containing protein [Tolypothrix sp. NIES-4075]|uniref:DUF4174 domain-containing protein n=1 Tax=Tolypothrix sp. NIES-4075 TaxID=2005459 RepID=UPI000B5CBD9F|nr:DUF4174 domain-containing protein [Tolypothrix sp. NIES-4075]
MLTRCLMALLLLTNVGCSSLYRADVSSLYIQNKSNRLVPIASNPKTVKNKNMAFDLKSYQWKNRLLLVFAPDENNPAYQKQMQLFQGQQADFSERDLLLVEILTEGTSRASGEAIDEADVVKVRSRFQSPEDFRVILVGKDGTQKRSDSKPVEAKVIFNEIDAMPMRQQEMQK